MPPRAQDVSSPNEYMSDSELMAVAIAQARKSLGEGGIPIGSVLARDGQLIAAGHNKRVQDDVR